MTYFLILDFLQKNNSCQHEMQYCTIFFILSVLLVKKRFSHLSWLTQVLCLSLYNCPSIGLIISTMCVFQLFILVMGPRPGLAHARPGACPFFRAWAQNFEKGPDSTQARARLFEKGLENLRFYEVKSRGPSRLGLDFV